MQQQPGGGQFGGSNQPNYFLPAPSPYQQQQGTPMSQFVHSPGSAIEPSPGGNVYSSMHQQQQLPSQQLYQYMAPSPAQQSELSRQLGFGSAPPSVGSPMAAGAGSGYRSQPPSLQSHIPPTPQPPTPRGPQTPASVGPIGSVGGDYNVASVGGPGSVNPATPRSVGEPMSVSDQQQSMAPKSVPMSNSGFAALLDQDSNSQMDSPQPQQQQHQSSLQQQQQQQAMGIGNRSGLTISSSLSNQGLTDGTNSASSAGRGQSLSSSGALAGTSATIALQNLEAYGPLALCSMGKELTQEMVNRAADMLIMLRTLTDPSQQFPKTATPEQQLLEREKRLSEHVRQTALLVHRLTAVCVQLEQLSKTRLPPDALDRVKELLPYMDQISKQPSENGQDMEVDKQPSFLEDIRQQAEKREEFQTTKAEHEKTKQELIKKREHLREIMEFLREFCWQISMVLESNPSS